MTACEHCGVAHRTRPVEFEGEELILCPRCRRGLRAALEDGEASLIPNALRALIARRKTPDTNTNEGGT